MIELERKFRIPKDCKSEVNDLLAEANRVSKWRIRQGYLNTGDPEVRLRFKKCLEGPSDVAGSRSTMLTVKKPRETGRLEVEGEMDKKAFEGVWPETKGLRVFKTRYVGVIGDNYTVEVDYFRRSLDPLIIAEVEFRTEKRASDFEWPLDCGHEVTANPAYKSANLARRTFSDI